MENRNILMAYIAGLFDGDGSFTLGRKKPSHEGQSSLYYPLIQFCNKDKSSLSIIKDVFGGHVNTRMPYMSRDGSKRQTSYTLKIEKATLCKPFLEALIPYLIIKRERAEFLLSFVNRNPFIRGSNKLSKEIIASREYDYIQMKLLNDQRENTYNISLRYARRNSHDECFWAYVAGLLDTDGSFSIKKEVRMNVKNPVYGPVISLSMVDSKAIQYVRNNCEAGKIMMVKSKAASQGFCYRFGIYGREEASLFIRKCLPYLTIKKDAALILLDFCEKYVSFAGPKGVPIEEIMFREDCHKRLVDMNKYGVSKSPLMDLKPLPGNAGGNKAEAAKAGTVNVVSEETPKGDAVL
jgi:hypothetical protein